MINSTAKPWQQCTCPRDCLARLVGDYLQGARVLFDAGHYCVACDILTLRTVEEVQRFINVHGDLNPIQAQWLRLDVLGERQRLDPPKPAQELEILNL